MVGEDGQIQSASETPVSLFGFAPEGVVGLCITDVVENLATGAAFLGGVLPLLELLVAKWVDGRTG